MRTIKVPREGFADFLELLAEHSRKYVLTGVSAQLCEGVYRVSVEGEGEPMGSSNGSGEPEDTVTAVGKR